MTTPAWTKLLTTDVRDLNTQVVALQNTFEAFSRTMSFLEKSTDSYLGTLESLNKTFSGLAVTGNIFFQNYEKYLSTFDKLNRSASAYGQNSLVLEKRISDLTKTTNLSRKELTDLVATLDSKTIGPRNFALFDAMISRVNKLGKTAEETKRILESLAQTQSKFGTGLGSFRGITGMELSQMDRGAFNDLLQARFMRPENLNSKQGNLLKDFQSVRTKKEEYDLTQQKLLAPLALGVAKFSQSVEGLTGGAAGLTVLAGGLLAGQFGLTQLKGIIDQLKIGRRTNSTTGGGYGGGVGGPQFFGPGSGWRGAGAGAAGAGGAGAFGFGPFAGGPQYFGPGGFAPGNNRTSFVGRAGGFLRRGMIGGLVGGAAMIGSQFIDEELISSMFGITDQKKAKTIAGGASGFLSGAGKGIAIGSLLGPVGALAGGALGGLAGSALGLSDGNKKGEEEEEALDKSKQLKQITDQIGDELLKNQVNEAKINELVKKHNELAGDTVEHLNANVVIIQGMFDKMQNFVKLQERMTNIMDSQVRSLQSMSNFYSEVSFEGEKSEAAAIKAAEKQLSSIDQQEAAWFKIKELKDAISKRGEENSVKEIQQADQLVKDYENQFGVSFDIMENEQKTLEFAEKRLKANRDLQTAQLKQEQTSLNLQNVYTQQAETFERITQTAKVGIGAEVGAVLNTARQYTKELNLQQQQMSTLQNMLSQTNEEYSKTQQDQSLTAEQKASKLEAIRTKQSSLRVDIEKKQVDVLNSQAKILEKLLTLRERYVYALPETGWAGFDFEASFDVSQSNGGLPLFGAPNQFVGGRYGGGLTSTSGGISPLGGMAGFSGPQNAYGMFGPQNNALGAGTSLGSAGAAQAVALQGSGYAKGGILNGGKIPGPTGGWIAELHNTDAAVLTHQQVRNLGLTKRDLVSAGVPAFDKGGFFGKIPAFDGGGDLGVDPDLQTMHDLNTDLPKNYKTMSQNYSNTFTSKKPPEEAIRLTTEKRVVESLKLNPSESLHLEPSRIEKFNRLKSQGLSVDAIRQKLGFRPFRRVPLPEATLFKSPAELVEWQPPFDKSPDIPATPYTRAEHIQLDKMIREFRLKEANAAALKNQSVLRRGLSKGTSAVKGVANFGRGSLPRATLKMGAYGFLADESFSALYDLAVHGYGKGTYGQDDSSLGGALSRGIVYGLGLGGATGQYVDPNKTEQDYMKELQGVGAGSEQFKEVIDEKKRRETFKNLVDSNGWAKNKNVMEDLSDQDFEQQYQTYALNQKDQQREKDNAKNKFKQADLSTPDNKMLDVSNFGFPSGPRPKDGFNQFAKDERTTAYGFGYQKSPAQIAWDQQRAEAQSRLEERREHEYSQRMHGTNPYSRMEHARQILENPHHYDHEMFKSYWTATGGPGAGKPDADGISQQMPEGMQKLYQEWQSEKNQEYQMQQQALQPQTQQADAMENQFTTRQPNNRQFNNSGWYGQSVQRAALERQQLQQSFPTFARGGILGNIPNIVARETNIRHSQNQLGLSNSSLTNRGVTSDISGNIGVNIGFDSSTGKLVVSGIEKNLSQNLGRATGSPYGEPVSPNGSAMPI